MRGLCVAAIVATTLSWSVTGWSDSGDPSASTPPSTAKPGSNDAVAFALYERATNALAAGDYQGAARDYARADDLSPTPAALKAALLAVLKTDDAVLGMTLASRTAREPFNQELTDLARRTRARFGDRTGQLVVICDGCEATVDDRPVEPGVATWQTLGEHRVTTRSEGRTEEQRVTVIAESVTSVRPPEAVGAAAPPPTSVEPLRAPSRDSDRPSEAGGISPAFFWVGLGITLAAGGGTIASFIDLRNIHQDFDEAPSPTLADEGNAAQLRTRVLLGVTSGLAVTTALVGIFAVDWGDDESVSLITDGRTVALRLGW
jgi:hypothetical protein